jgi:hypothetical protein
MVTTLRRCVATSAECWAILWGGQLTRSHDTEFAFTSHTLPQSMLQKLVCKLMAVPPDNVGRYTSLLVAEGPRRTRLKARLIAARILGITRRSLMASLTTSSKAAGCTDRTDQFCARLCCSRCHRKRGIQERACWDRFVGKLFNISWCSLDAGTRRTRPRAHAALNQTLD